MELEALATEKVANKSICCAAVESNPVPTAGADPGNIYTAASVAVALNAASDIHLPIPITFAVVPAPIARHTKSALNSHVTFVLAVTLRAMAPPLNAITEPKRTSNVRLPGDAVKVDTRPRAVTRIARSMSQKFAGNVNFSAAAALLVP